MAINRLLTRRIRPAALMLLLALAAFAASQLFMLGFLRQLSLLGGFIYAFPFLCLAAVALVYGASWTFLRRGVIAIASTLAIHMVVAATLLLAGKSGDPNIGFGMTWLVLFCVLYLVTIVGCILGEVDEAKDR